ncbi:MAG TPA: MmgE/PrpD family protein [Natronosporangium sp.]
MPGKRTAAQRIAEFVTGLRYDDLPEPVRQAAKLHALDTIGVAIAGAVLPGEAATARAALAVFAGMGGPPEASLIGRAERVAAAHAAYANAALAHALDFDDIHTDSRVHASACVVPAAFAVAERLGASGRDLVTALVAGTEVAVRIGMGGPIHFQQHGFHGTPVAGVFGAVASAAALLGLDPVAATRAFGVAGDAAGGTNAWIAEGTANKHLHAGWAAHNGILATDLAAHGAEGPPGVFEGRYGIYEALTGEADVDLSHVLDTMGTVWETPKQAYKAYPSCYWMHGSLAAARQLRDQLADQLDRIESVTAIVPTPAVTIVLEPRETRIRPLTPYAGKFSLQFSVAAMLLRGVIDLASYTAPSLADPRVLDLAARVDYTVSVAFDAGTQLYPGGLTVRLRDGREFTVEVPEPPGTELNPLTEDQLLGKFRANAGYGLAEAEVTELAEAIRNLEDPDAVPAVGRLLRRVRAR